MVNHDMTHKCQGSSITQQAHHFALILQARCFALILSAVALLQLLQTVRRCKPLCALSSARDCAVLAQLLREEGYLVTEHGSGTQNASRRKGNNCLESLHHNYLTCTGTSRLRWKVGSTFCI